MNEIAISIIIVLIFFFSPLILSIRALIKLKKIPLLEYEVRRLSDEIETLKRGTVEVIPIESETPVALEEKIVEKPLIKAVEITRPDSPDIKAKSAGKENTPPKKRTAQIGKWNQERAFAFLGAFLGIIGLVFLTMYLGSVIGIFFRFMIMTGFSALLLAISYPLGKREKWEELSHISRSFSGALFLFAVFASSTIAGLKWIESPLLSLVVISAGTLYNLVLGGLCRKKGYMIFHMAINFLVIFLLPAEPLVFWLAFLLTMGLQVFGSIRKEELNSGLSLLLFTLYSLYFKETATDFLYFSWCFNFTALIAFVNFTLYEDKVSKLKKVISYAVPILWIGTAAYLGDSKWESAIPLLVGVITGVIIRLGKSRNYRKLIFWPLQLLISGILLILASESGTQYWLVLLYIESSFFIYWAISEQEYKTPPLLLNYLILVSAVLYMYFSKDLVINIFSIANRVLLIFSASFFMLKASDVRMGKSKDFFTLLNIFHLMVALFAFLLSFTVSGVVTVRAIVFFTGLSLIVLFISNKSILHIRSYGVWGVLLIPLFMVIAKLFNESDYGFTTSILLIIPLLVLSFIPLVYNKLQKTLIPPNPGVYVFSFVLIVFFYFPFRQISSIIPGVLLLLAAFAYYLFWENREDRDFQMGGTIILLLFFLRHITHNLQLEEYFWFFNIRLLIEISSLPVFYLYMKSSRWNEKLHLFQKTAFIVSWLMILLMIFSHSNRNVLSMVFQLSAVLLLSIDRKKYLEGYPLLSLAFIHFIFAQVNLALNTHPSFPFLPGILQNPWIFGFVNLGTSVLVIFLFFKHLERAHSDIFPIFTSLKKMTSMVVKKKNLFLLIPLFVSLGLFFNWTLEETALTIALFCGSFILYGTALILKENVFRHATSAALLGTSVRLIFWDLAQSTLLAKSIAFLGASVIFILINILYSQFKGRFENV